MPEALQRIEQFIIDATLELLSGTRIGGSDDLLGIGTVDLTCIKHPTTHRPYLPGSSLKGKMRSELEKQMGKFGGRDSNQPCGCGLTDCPVCRIFGPHFKLNHMLGPTRIIVRDALLISGGDFETKTENIIDRSKGTALHPRQVERVVEGSTFAFQIVMNVLEMDRGFAYDGQKGGPALFKVARHGMQLLENTGIGSGVGKGYGRIRFDNVKAKTVKLPNFEEEIAAL